MLKLLLWGAVVFLAFVEFFVVYVLCRAASYADWSMYGEDNYFSEDQDRAIAEWKRKHDCNSK